MPGARAAGGPEFPIVSARCWRLGSLSMSHCEPERACHRCGSQRHAVPSLPPSRLLETVLAAKSCILVSNPIICISSAKQTTRPRFHAVFAAFRFAWQEASIVPMLFAGRFGQIDTTNASYVPRERSAGRSSMYSAIGAIMAASGTRLVASILALLRLGSMASWNRCYPRQCFHPNRLHRREPGSWRWAISDTAESYRSTRRLGVDNEFRLRTPHLDSRARRLGVDNKFRLWTPQVDSRARRTVGATASSHATRLAPTALCDSPPSQTLRIPGQ